ncbi:hypothetical protein CEXT_733601 [Caerostris extrusa]|uniref:Uncharacterized protein n=1 Tax=Caerostris extrusa TaxID=172846 RepID=A0AAV4U1P0_CAEEX|nr:hypothetical protein CEXT_733601 [Caerostris extrusa]
MCETNRWEGLGNASDRSQIAIERFLPLLIAVHHCIFRVLHSLFRPSLCYYRLLADELHPRELLFICVPFQSLPTPNDRKTTPLRDGERTAIKGLLSPPPPSPFLRVKFFLSVPNPPS